VVLSIQVLEDISRNLDYVISLLEDSTLTVEETLLLRKVDEMVEKGRLEELVDLDEI